MEKQTYYKVVINAKNERIQYVVGGFETKEKAVEFPVHNDYIAFFVSNEEVLNWQRTFLIFVRSNRVFLVFIRQRISAYDQVRS
jgi:hypothetical protein